MTFYKKPSYFFKVIRQHKEIKIIDNKYRGKKHLLLKSKDDEDREKAVYLKCYINNRGNIHLDDKTGYFKYSNKLKTIIISTDNYYDKYNNVFEHITYILNNTLIASLRNNEYEFLDDKFDNKRYRIGYINKNSSIDYRYVKPIISKYTNLYDYSKDSDDDDYDSQYNTQTIKDKLNEKELNDRKKDELLINLLDIEVSILNKKKS